MTPTSRIIEDSLHAITGIRLTTVLVENYPKGLGMQDITRHRSGAFFEMEYDAAFSVESGRAIPAANIRGREMYIPKFLANRPGMVPGQEVEDAESCAIVWEELIEKAMQSSVNLELFGVHKDLCNAPLDFCAPISFLITMDHHGWQNYLTQRCAHDARPQVRELSQQIYDQWIAATPKTVEPGGLHLPFITDEERAAGHDLSALKHASAARCARVSTGRHLEIRSIWDELKQGLKLARDRHWSPLEHPCKALNDAEVDFVWYKAHKDRDKSGFGPFDPSWRQLRKMYPDEHGYIRGPWDPAWRLGG